MEFDIFNVITLLGGLAFFLYGMSTMGAGLERLSGSKMEKILQKLTNNIFLSILFGAAITAAVQSSSATTVIVVGLVNAGILKLRQAVGVIMGANIGTTITSQIIRLGDLQDTNILMRLLKPTSLAPIAAVIGIALFMFAASKKTKNVGSILLGFGVLFSGMNIMTETLKPLGELPQFAEMFATLSNPVLGVLVGAVVTALIQSSSASIGILQALSATGAITYSSAIPILLGQNIGTCITPLLSSIGANKNAKRAAMVHLYFNIIGTAVFLGGIYLIQYTIGFPFWDDVVGMGGIANFHTIFNVITTVLFIPFVGALQKLAELTIRKQKDGEATPEVAVLDERFLVSPALALQQCQSTVEVMAQYAFQNFHAAHKLFKKFDAKAVVRIRELENSIDMMEDKLNSYLLMLADRELTEVESHGVTTMLHIVSEFERIGDYTINLVEAAESLHEKQVSFSDSAIGELNAIADAVYEIIGYAQECFKQHDIEIAYKIEPLEETVDDMEDYLKLKHIDRLKDGKCTIDAGVIFLEVLNNLERISDHCSNVAVYIIGNDREDGPMERHNYLKEIHEGQYGEYAQLYEAYKAKYMSRII